MTTTEHRVSFFDLQRLQVRGLIERGKLERVFDRDVDVDLAMDLIYGPLYSDCWRGTYPLANRWQTRSCTGCSTDSTLTQNKNRPEHTY